MTHSEKMGGLFRLIHIVENRQALWPRKALARMSNSGAIPICTRYTLMRWIDYSPDELGESPFIYCNSSDCHNQGRCCGY